MRTPVLVVMVLLHAAAIGSLFFIQGCGAPGISMPSQPPVIPEPVIEKPALPPAGCRKLHHPSPLSSTQRRLRQQKQWNML